MKKQVKPAQHVEESDEEDSDFDGEETSEQEDERANDLREGEVGAKYRVASDVANKVLAQLVKDALPGKKILDLVTEGDKLINEGVASAYKDPKIEKGIAFPPCVSVNNCVGHFSPLAPDTSVIADGDLVKIDLGVHVDGYIASVAHSFVARAPAAAPAAGAAPAAAPAPAAGAAPAAAAAPAAGTITGRAADVISAAHFAAEAALRLLKPGRSTAEVSEVIGKIAEVFKCQPVQGVLSHAMRRHLIDSAKVIMNKPTLDAKADDFPFEENDVWCVDIVMSTGEGKTREAEARTTVFKHNLDANYQLKIQAARATLHEIQNKHPTMPFSLRALTDPRQAKLGLKEMVQHDLLQPYPVLFERAGELVAQVKFTALILPTSTDRITTHPLPPLTSQYKIEDPKLLEILAMGTKRMKKNKKAKKKKAAKPAAAGAAAAAKPAAKPAAAPAAAAAKPAAAMDTTAH